MLVTFTNTSSTASLELPAPVGVTLAASGSTTLGVTMDDFLDKNGTGNPPSKLFDDLIKQGKLTVSVANDPLSKSIMEILRQATGGDVAGSTGFHQTISGLFSEALAASQTDNQVGATGWVATKAGSILSFSAALSAAITGSATTVNARIAKNGTAISATQLDFTQAGAEVKDYATFTKDTHTFVAGDVISVVYTSTGITNTPTLACAIEVEM